MLVLDVEDIYITYQKQPDSSRFGLISSIHSLHDTQLASIYMPYLYGMCLQESFIFEKWLQIWLEYLPYSLFLLEKDAFPASINNCSDNFRFSEKQAFFDTFFRIFGKKNSNHDNFSNNKFSES